MKNICWGLAKETNRPDFEKKAETLKEMNISAWNWLDTVGKEQWSVAFSSTRRQ